MSSVRYVGASLIDGTGAEPIPDAVLLVGDSGAIDYAGTAAASPASPDAAVVDLGGRTLLPGFIDAHVHFALDLSAGPAALLAIRPTTRVFEAAERLRATLHAGITSARDLGGLDAGYRDSVERGLIDGPRLHVALRMMGHTGGHSDFTLPSRIDLAGTLDLSAIADNQDEARRETRKLLRDGADVIKLCATGGMASPSDDPGDEGLTEAEIAAIVDETRRHKNCRPVAAHAQSAAGILNAVRGGVASVEHGYEITPEGRDLMLERGTYLVPTLSCVRLPERGTVPDDQWQFRSRWAAITKENIAASIDAGITIALGTDSGAGCPHAQNLNELAYLIELGMTPMQAIVAGTRTAARLLGVDEHLGTLETGKTADFIVTGGNPITDITTLTDPTHILLVVQGGHVKKNTLH